MQLLAQVKTRLHSIRTLSAVCTHVNRKHRGQSHSGTSVIIETRRIRLMRPNFSRIDTVLLYKKAGEKQWHNTPDFQTDASDGQTEWRVYPADHEFDRGKASANGKDVWLYDVAPLDGFFDPQEFLTTKIDLLRQEGLLRSLTLRPTIHMQGVSYRQIRIVYQRIGSQVVETEDYWVGADLLIHRIHTALSTGTVENTVTLSHIRVNRRMAGASFAYSPPPGSHPRKQVAEPDTASLLAKGAVAPDLTVQDAQGNPIRLADLRGKWVILDFWATWCGPCLQAMPALNAMANQYKDKNVVALAICVGDAPKVFQAWLPKHRDLDSIRFAIDPVGMDGDGVSKLYRVGALPTQYLIDPDGKISASFVGHDGKSDNKLEEALKAVSLPSISPSPLPQSP